MSAEMGNLPHFKVTQEEPVEYKQVEESAHMAKGKKTLLLDFDRTMVNPHFHNELMEKIGLENYRKLNLENRLKIIEILFPNKEAWVKNPSELKKLISDFIHSGLQVGIVSFTEFPEVIFMVLDYLFGKDSAEYKHFNLYHNVITGLPDSAEFEAHAKNPYIAQVIKNVQGDPQHTYYADDDIDNINMAVAEKLVLKSNAFWVTDAPIYQFDPNNPTHQYCRNIRIAAGLIQPLTFSSTVSAAAQVSDKSTMQGTAQGYVKGDSKRQ